MKTLFPRLILLIPLVGLAGCFSHGPQDIFYMLKSADIPQRTGSTYQAGPLLGFGPIRVPAYLDRPQIVVAASPETYRLSEGHRWAERLDDNIARVSMENLGALLPASRIILYPWPREPKPDGQITLDIQDMHLTQEGRVLMQALWSFRGRQSPPQSFRFSCNEPASTTDFAKMVEVESHCLERLNRDMAKSVQGFR
ncbi:MAG: membrane integrity-associated transporter subunit PqiC [Methylococcus sp.]|jgi:uncharacterized lipoprotein YmbA|nr:MAG: membrane integrity-associated transporter subunit PqiC [Methylococcus sp.]